MSGALSVAPLDGVALNPSYDPNSPSALDEGSTLSQLIRWFTDWAWIMRDERDLAMRDRAYVDGDQWTPDERRILAKRGQAALVINRIVRKVEYLRGFEKRLKSDPKAFPRNPVDEPESDVATQLLRWVSDDNSYDQIRSDVWDNLLVEGLGGGEVVVEQGQDGPAVRQHHVPYERIWRDPHASKANFSDARYMGSLVWMDRDEAEEMYPGRAEAVADTMTLEDNWGTFADKPRLISWTDSRRERVMIVQGHWKQRGEWWTGTFTRGGFLAPPVVSPYIDRRGKSCSPLRLRRLYRDQDNNCYGVVRQYIGLQDELNHRRSKALHLVNVRQIKAEIGATEDVDKTRAELAKPDGYVEVRPNALFEVLPTGDMATGQFELMRETAAEIDATGPNAAMAGKDPREQSGRAIQAQQQGGAVENEPSIDSLRQWDREMYEASWMRCRQFLTDPQTIRVTNDDNAINFTHLNKPVTVADELSRMDPDRRAMVMQQMALQPGDPRLQQVLRVENDIDSLDVDITVEDGPDISTLQSEQFNFLQGRQDVPLKLLIKYSALPKKADMLKDLDDVQNQQAQAQAVQQAHALAMEQAKIGLIQAQTAQAAATAKLRGADAVDRLHGVALDFAQATQPGLPMQTGQPPAQPDPQPSDAVMGAPLPPPDVSMIPMRPPLQATQPSNQGAVT